MTHPSPALFIAQAAALIPDALVYMNNPKRIISSPFSASSLHLARWAFLVLTHGFERNIGRTGLQKI